MNDNSYKNTLSFDIKELKRINNIPDEDIKYFDLLYKHLDETSYYTKMALMAVSYSFEKEISLEDRTLFIKGMSNYIDVYKLLSNNENFQNESDENKEKIVLGLLNDRIKQNEGSDSYIKGIASAIKLVGTATKEEKVRKRNH